MTLQLPALHARTHLPDGSDPLEISSPVWQDVLSAVTVTRVTGGDTNPDITGIFSLARQLDSGALTIIQLCLQIGAGGAGSGTSQYLLHLGTVSPLITNVPLGVGIMYQTGAVQPIYRTSLMSTSIADTLVWLWDGGATGKNMGPASSTGGGPVNWGVGDVIFNGQLFFQNFL